MIVEDCIFEQCLYAAEVSSTNYMRVTNCDCISPRDGAVEQVQFKHQVGFASGNNARSVFENVRAMNWGSSRNKLIYVGGVGSSQVRNATVTVVSCGGDFGSAIVADPAIQFHNDTNVSISASVIGCQFVTSGRNGYAIRRTTATLAKPSVTVTANQLLGTWLGELEP